MYGKIFESMYDGTIVVNWKGLITFQQMIVLCDSDGIIDMTQEALSKRTGIPLGIIKEGIKYLSEPDPESRSPVQDGRRIVLIDENRSWGWIIVNHQYYRDLSSNEDRREKARLRKQKQRTKEAEEGDVTLSHTSSRMSHHTNTNTNTDTNKSKDSKQKRFKKPTLEEVINYFTNNGYTEESARKAFKYYEEAEPPWTDSTGKKVKSWKQKMVGNWFKPEDKIGNSNESTNRQIGNRKLTGADVMAAQAEKLFRT